MLSAEYNGLPQRGTMTNPLGRLLNTPLAQLLRGVSPDVFDKTPTTVSMRDLSRDMASTLAKLRNEESYTVVTMRGAPSFLVIPIDPQAWSSLLVATAPDVRGTDDPTTLPSAQEVIENVSEHA